MLTNSQIATLGYINERPGKRTVVVIGFEMAADLERLGYITIKGGKCYPTPAAAPYKGRSPQQQRADMVDAHAALMGRYASL
jgi:hypothetical protein